MFEGEFPRGRWVYEDTGEPLPGWGGEIRPCAKCGSQHEMHESDACLGDLPGVDNACCGHGRREESYIRFTNGTVIRGFEVERGIRGVKADLVEQDGLSLERMKKAERHYRRIAEHGGQDVKAV